MKDEFLKLVRFSLVGVFNTLLYALLYLIFLHIFGNFLDDTIALNLSSTISWFICVAISFKLNKKFTFKSTSQDKSEAIKFLAISAIQYIANILLLNFFISLNIKAEIAGVLVLPFTTLIGFFGNSFWSFRNR